VIDIIIKGAWYNGRVGDGGPGATARRDMAPRAQTLE